MKLGDSIKKHANVTFANSKFIGRDPKTMLAVLNVGIKGSDNMRLMPRIQNVEVKKIDDLHDELSLIWDDYKVNGVVTWRQSADNRSFVFVNYK